MTDPEIIGQVYAAGGQLLLLGDNRLRVTAPAPLPDDLVARLRDHKPMVLAMLRQNLPTEWSTGLAALRAMSPPSAFARLRWRQMVADAETFTGRWGRPAVMLGWDTFDLFGVGRDAPHDRIDLMGLVPLLAGCAVLALTGESARLRTPSGRVQSYCRKPVFQHPRVFLWTLGNVLV